MDVLKRLQSYPSDTGAKECLSLASLRTALLAADSTGSELLKHAHKCGLDLDYNGGDTSAEAADDWARELVGKSPHSEPGLGEIDIMRDVVDGAVEDLRNKPCPCLTIHKPFDVAALPRRLAGPPSTAGGRVFVTDDELERVKTILGGLVLFEPAAVEQLRKLLKTMHHEKSQNMGPGVFYDMKEDKNVDVAALRKRMRGLVKASASGSLDEAGSKLRSCFDIIDHLQRRQGQALNAMLRERHSTFGRFFTGPEVMRVLADRLRARGRLVATDVYIDFSCGTNEFGAMLGLKRWVGFDILPPSTNACREHFRWVNWFDVSDVPPKAVIGLNPPFGVGGETARLFINKSLNFKPRLLALIVPRESVKNMVYSSNKFLATLRKKNQEDAECRAHNAPGGGRSKGERHPWLKKGGAPDYLLVDYEPNATSRDAFYMPASLKAAAFSGSNSRVSQPSRGAGTDWSGDYRGAPAGQQLETVKDRGIPIAPE